LFINLHQVWQVGLVMNVCESVIELSTSPDVRKHTHLVSRETKLWQK